MPINHILDFYNMKLKMSKKGLSTFKGGGGVPDPPKLPICFMFNTCGNFFYASLVFLLEIVMRKKIFFRGIYSDLTSSFLSVR